MFIGTEKKMDDNFAFFLIATTRGDDEGDEDEDEEDERHL